MWLGQTNPNRAYFENMSSKTPSSGGELGSYVYSPKFKALPPEPLFKIEDRLRSALERKAIDPTFACLDYNSLIPICKEIGYSLTQVQAIEALIFSRGTYHVSKANNSKTNPLNVTKLS